MINVTKAYLPPMVQYTRYIEDVFKRAWLTNNGPLVNELELRLKHHLKLDHLLFLSNGTIALQIAIKALQLTGEVITTPFSYVATTSSIVWEHCEPVFADIDPKTFNIDPARIEAAITDRTTAILATHVFGNPCDLARIEAIAEKYSLSVIYDAAHCFGVEVAGASIFTAGTISTTSFHATKLYHTIEGGAVFTKDAALLETMARLRNFGHTSPTTFDGVGINGKNSEFHAAMGLCVLENFDAIFQRRKVQWNRYRDVLADTALTYQSIAPETKYNYSYFPVVFSSEAVLLQALKTLNDHQINPRRYFYPSLNTLDYVKGHSCPVSEDLATRVLCLPLYHDLTQQEQDMICRLLIRSLKYSV